MPGEREVVLVYPPTQGLSGNGMTGLSPTSVFYPAGLMMQAPDSALRIFPHGTPNGHAVTMKPTQGGGGGC